MKVLVTIKRTPQRDAKIRFGADGSLDLASVKFEVNPFDELAVEEALKLKESRSDTDEVVIATVGGEECRQQLLAALAMGADRAVRVDADTGRLDSLQIARFLAAVVEKEAPDLVLSGKLAVDDEAGQVPGMLAAVLGWPLANQASTVTIDDAGKTATVACEVDSGLEDVELTLPAVITADLRLNEPRYASLPGIMKAKRKPLDVLPAGELGCEDRPSRMQVLGYRALPEKPPGVKVESAAELVAALKEKKLV